MHVHPGINLGVRVRSVTMFRAPVRSVVGSEVSRNLAAAVLENSGVILGVLVPFSLLARAFTLICDSATATQTVFLMPTVFPYFRNKNKDAHASSIIPCTPMHSQIPESLHTRTLAIIITSTL